jgi:hypothetical protein
MIKIEVLEYLIKHGPGRTELELAKAIHGESGYQQQVNQDLALLVGRGAVERRSEAPYRYFPAKVPLRLV